VKEEILEDIGFSKNEAKLYLTMLELGPSVAGKISEKSKLHRTNVYDALERLVKKGTVSYIIKGKTKYYKATNPENLLAILEEKEKRLKAMLPELLLSQQLAEDKGKAHIFEGLKAFTAILNNFLKYKEPILVYGLKREVPHILRNFIPHFHKKRIQMKIPMKHIYNHNAKERIQYLNSLPYTEARHLPKQYDSPVTTNICGNEVNLTLWLKSPLTIQIISKEIADSYKKYFELLWGVSKAI